MGATAYSDSENKKLFKNKKVDYKSISDQKEKELQDKRDALKGKIGGAPSISISDQNKKQRTSVSLNSTKDISGVYIPEQIGKVVEAHESQNAVRLVAHIQDLHCNPEAAFNMANILEILVKDYGLSLVCSEGAEGPVDTSSVSGFPDAETREKVAKLFVNSGELTGEEYLSITKYPKLPIWGIENKDIYFENISEFNKIMERNPDTMVFINNVKETLNKLKSKVYSKKLLEIDAKYNDYEASRLDASKYLDFLLSLNPEAAQRYKNISLFRETLALEKQINQKKIIEESQTALKNLQSVLSPGEKNKDLDEFAMKAALFKDKKLSPYGFYSHLNKLTNEYIKGGLSGYPELSKYTDYLNKTNMLDGISLFQEIDDLTYDTMDFLSEDKRQKSLTDAIKKINTIDSLFNIRVSNEQYEYYLKNKASCNVGFFKSTITGLSQDAGGIDYDPSLIDNRLAELERFYDIAYQRDIAMSNNAIKKIEEANAGVSAIITGGFHSRGITKALKEKGYSFIVIAPYSNTSIDEENYRFLLSGKRKPIESLIQEMNK